MSVVAPVNPDRGNPQRDDFAPERCFVTHPATAFPRT
jgi:hypothetical protein